MSSFCVLLFPLLHRISPCMSDWRVRRTQVEQKKQPCLVLWTSQLNILWVLFTFGWSDIKGVSGSMCPGDSDVKKSQDSLAAVSNAVLFFLMGIKKWERQTRMPAGFGGAAVTKVSKNYSELWSHPGHYCLALKFCPGKQTKNKTKQNKIQQQKQKFLTWHFTVSGRAGGCCKQMEQEGKELDLRISWGIGGLVRTFFLNQLRGFKLSHQRSSHLPSLTNSTSHLQAPRNHSKWAEVFFVDVSIKLFVDL